MKLVEDHDSPNQRGRVDVVQTAREAVWTIEKPAQHLIVGGDNDRAAVKERIVRLFARLESDFVSIVAGQ